ncbi:MAG: hypothetical protein KatS3mg115_0689 [Candidatus Poribacteria bacterium]|nr:MAG: hypothetical protein KatS3mg115_0689 [Candidatus Poribacteria bacterium]
MSDSIEWTFTAEKEEKEAIAPGRGPRVRWGRVLLHTTLILGSFVFALPFLWLVGTSFKWDREVFAEPESWFGRLVPRLPYRVTRTPYVATAETRPFRQPPAMDPIAWEYLKSRLEPILWDAVQPILAQREVPDALRNELRHHLTRDLWDRIQAEFPDSFWRRPFNEIQAGLTQAVTQQKVNNGWELIYRAIRLGPPTAQTLDRIESALGAPQWIAQRGGVQLVPAPEAEREAVELWTNYSDTPRPPYLSYLVTELTLPFPAAQLRALTIPLHADESYHHFTATVELGGKTFSSDRPIVLDTYTWQEVVLQVRGEPGPHERDNVLLHETGEPSEVVGPDRVRITLTLHRAPYPLVVWRKFIHNYVEASTFVRFWRFVWNTVIVTALNIVAQLISCSLVAYAFARLRWPGRDPIFMLLLSTMMLPPQVTMIPVFLIMRKLGLYDTLHPLWIGSLFGSAFFIFLLRQFFLTIPRDLEEAAMIDGCGFFGIYWRVMLPLVKPALAAIAIFQFMGAWNDFLGPLIYIAREEKMTLSLGLQLFQSMHSTEYGMLMAASTMMTLPVIAIFFLAQRYFIQGVTLTGLKG